MRDYCHRAKAAGLDSFAAIEPLSEHALEARLFTTGVDPDAPDEDVARPPVGRPTPDWAVVHRELKKPGVTRILLWQEYLAQHPGGYRYTQFTQLYKAWAAGAVAPGMRRQHQPGAMIEVDYAGMTLPIRIGDTIRTAAVFVACLPYSGYLFAEDLVLHDLWRLGGLYRVASFVGLAICLTLVALLLQKFVLRPQSEAE